MGDAKEKKSGEKKKAETYIDGRGYLRFVDSDMLVHRWVPEKVLGRKLKRGEVVHHTDRNKLNNKRENLEVMSDDEHTRLHAYDRGLGFGLMHDLICGIISFLRGVVSRRN